MSKQLPHTKISPHKRDYPVPMTRTTFKKKTYIIIFKNKSRSKKYSFTFVLINGKNISPNAAKTIIHVVREAIYNNKHLIK